MGMRLGYRPGMLPVTEAMSSRIVRLPFYPELDEAVIESIVNEVSNFFSVGSLASTG